MANNTLGGKENPTRRKLSLADEAELLRLAGLGLGEELLAVHFGISFMSVRNVKRRAAQKETGPATDIDTTPLDTPGHAPGCTGSIMAHVPRPTP